MKLFIQRDQAKKLLGGVKFEIVARTELDEEEKALVKRYKVGSEMLCVKEKKIPLTNRVLQFKITIDSLMRGETFKCESIAEIIEYEEGIKEACKNFYVGLQVMKGFGGEEIISYPEALEEEVA